MTGRVHSLESFGTVDGPGLRYVVFLQGCPMRCLYCHNPDTWDPSGGTEMTAGEILAQFRKNREFYSNGGITVTGGEPLLQVDFLIELFTLCRQEAIHTCIDTSGITYRGGDSGYDRKLEQLLSLTDLVMLDIKHIDPAAHKALTGQDNAHILRFARHVSELGIELWVRHVVVPGYTDKEEDLIKLGRFLGTLKRVRALDVLPYHTMGVSKYAQLGMEYPLAGIPALDKSAAVAARQKILQGYREARQTT